MEKTLIITSHLEHANRLTLDFSEFQTIICADGGLLVAQSLDLSPDFLIGDYDSAKVPARDVIKLPMEKDMTDSEAAIDLAVSKGYKNITLLGGIGGRFDHTMGNIGMLAKFCGSDTHLSLVDGQNYLFMIAPGTYTVPKNAYTYMGIISYGDDAENVTLRGVKYPLTNHHLTNKTTLGVSNEITGDFATISFTKGRLLVILSKDL